MIIKVKVNEVVEIEAPTFMSNWAVGSDEWMEELDEHIQDNERFKEMVRDEIVLDYVDWEG